MNPPPPAGSSPRTALIIGGGFFGCTLGVMLRRMGWDALVVEEGGELMERASRVNQARVHGGYHYPRSLMTALRSRRNYARFCADYRDAVEDSFTKIYAVGRRLSKVSADQFSLFMQRIGAPLKPAPPRLRALFNSHLIEDAWIAEECAFNYAALRDITRERMDKAGVDLAMKTRVERVERRGDGLLVYLSNGQTREADWVFNCTYSGINRVRAASSLPLIPLKHELTEMCLVELPEALERISVTVMCGPFFSFMPYPARGLTTLSHVRYTPHLHWFDRPEEAFHDPYARFDRLPKESAFPFMAADAARYMPALADCRHRDSLWEVKTVLPLSEADDGRPILFQQTPEMPRLVNIMGGKIDNVYDVEDEIRALLHPDARHVA